MPDDDSSRFLTELQQEFGKPETMDRLFQTVLPHLEAGKKTLVYILAQVERIGHAAMEPLFLKTLYAAKYDRIVIVTGKGSGAGYNPFILKCIGPEFVVVETDDKILPLLGFLDNAIHDLQLFDLCLASPQRLIREYGRYVVSGGDIRFFELPASIEKSGNEFLKLVGKPDGAPFILLHVREPSYLPEKTFHRFRCADVGAYTAAIQEFVSAGFWVFRIGDSQSTPLEGYSHEVVDIVRHEAYSKELDVFLAARCAFGFNYASGPEALLRAFGRTAATVNLHFELLRLPLRSDVLLFKHYADMESGKVLTYPEILDRDVPAITLGNKLAEAGIEIRQNSPDELRDVARLMINWHSGTQERLSVDPEKLERFRALGRTYEVSLKEDAEKRLENHDFYAYAHDFGVPAPSVLAREGYLDRP
ncbi:TIGR04372 family glycosyltransferase [Nisaea acidiphila]|uniref:TIGR04372 family glycosyltransferase n=1 Tax=Nisaea acidiphila TaxID=1862145 RepID=A0A9J7B1F7_9PROT|nr:TIGR04372 family glycosyltransferase [Nisaea acidiphila]UUX52276.1 TIGR04372 family glycosyltransferase [Nisaea acidiphila]